MNFNVELQTSSLSRTALIPPVVNLFLSFVDHTYYGSIPTRGVCPSLEKTPAPASPTVVYALYVLQ